MVVTALEKSKCRRPRDFRPFFIESLGAIPCLLSIEETHHTERLATERSGPPRWAHWLQPPRIVVWILSLPFPPSVPTFSLPSLTLYNRL